MATGTRCRAKSDGLGDRTYPDRDLKLLFGLAAARCSYPDCHKECIEAGTPHDRAVVIGKVAHIEAHSDTGPRANPRLSKKERDCYDNWILLCSNHHDLVDGQPNTYSIATLRHWKAEHEAWVHGKLHSAMPGVSSYELRIVASAILNAPDTPSDSFTLTPPKAKMEKNGLGASSRSMLMMGIAKSRDVETFIEGMAKLDPDFPERLRSGFLERYDDLYQEGLRGDALFFGMQDFAIGASSEFNIQAAGLAVLSYMFERCEVFEK